MDKKSLVLIAFFPAGEGTHSPAQSQKLIFLIQKKLPDIIPTENKFNFISYDYGAFDKNVYEILRELIIEGLISIIYKQGGSFPYYKLTLKGIEKAKSIYANLKKSEQNSIRALSKKIHSMSFSELISYVYTKYPEMKKNSPVISTELFAREISVVGRYVYRL